MISSQRKMRLAAVLCYCFPSNFVIRIILQLSQHLVAVRNKGDVLCTAENQPIMNGDITSSACIKSDICDSTDVNDKTVINVRRITLTNIQQPAAERCHLSETGDQLQTDVEIPLSATFPTSENVGDCCESPSGNEDCSTVGMFGSDVNILSLFV